MKSRWRVVGVAAVLAAWLAAPGVGLGPSTAFAAPLLPNLVADPPDELHLTLHQDPGGEVRLLVRFYGYVRNAGPGPVELRGSSPFGPLDDLLMGSVVQRVYDEDGAVAEELASPATLRYETTDGHNHWHLLEATRYSLWNFERTAEVGPAQKVGFCLADIEATVPDPTEPDYRYDADIDRCSWHDPTSPETTGPNATSALMGITPGWRDVYDWTIPLQWVDVSDVSPGAYWLRAEMNPDSLVSEDPAAPPEVPVFGPEAIVVPGYLAQPLQIGHVPANRRSTIELESADFGKGGGVAGRQFRIVDGPEHGTLTVDGAPAGDGWHRTRTVEYTPEPDYFGPDTFSYAAGDVASQFPLHPQAAAAALQVGVGAPTALTISGAPAQLRASASVQLDAIVTAGPSPDVTWKVDGVPGGSAGSGTISPSGLYRAPSGVPGGGLTVHVGATSEDGVTAQEAIRIVPPPPVVPAPDLAPPTVAPSPRGRPRSRSHRGGRGGPRTRAGRLLARRRGRQLLVRVVPPRRGRLIVIARKRRRPLARCGMQVARRRPAVCNMRLPRRYARIRRTRLRVVAVLRAPRGGRRLRAWRLGVR